MIGVSRKDGFLRDLTEPEQQMNDARVSLLNALENLRGAAERLTAAHLLTLHPVYADPDRASALANLRYRLTEPYTILAALEDEMGQASRLGTGEPEVRLRDPAEISDKQQQQEWARKFNEQIRDITGDAR